MAEEAQADCQKWLLLGRDFHNWTEGPGLVQRNHFAAADSLAAGRGDDGGGGGSCRGLRGRAAPKEATELRGSAARRA